MVHRLMCTLPNVDTYWIVNRKLKPERDNDRVDIPPYNCLWKALDPGDAEGSDELCLPLPRLHKLGVGILPGESSDLLDDLCIILESRKQNGMTDLDCLSLPLIPRPEDDDTRVAARLLELVSEIHWDQDVDFRSPSTPSKDSDDLI